VEGLSDREDLSKQLQALLELSKERHLQFRTVRNMCLRELSEEDFDCLVAWLWRMRLPDNTRVQIYKRIFGALHWDTSTPEFCKNVLTLLKANS
jgi:hypothetical protein